MTTSHSRVITALRALRVSGTDVFVDLGCGDGRVALAAAADFGAVAVGIDICPSLLRCCRRGAEAAGFDCAPGSRLMFLLADMGMLFEDAPASTPPNADEAAALDVVQRATAIYAYLLPEVMPKLTPALLRAIARGTRVLTLDYHLLSATDADAMAALPPDCQSLTHLLAPTEVHLFGQMRLYSAHTLPALVRAPVRPSTSRSDFGRGCLQRLRPCLECVGGVR